MKATEYFEKYFADIDTIPAEEVQVRLTQFMSEMSKEVLDICEKRHSNSDLCVEGAIKEQNNKFNSVGNMIEKKYGKPLLKRNGFINYWNKQFEHFVQEKQE